nr:MAG TPA: hypothetical protein [Caudoviricetes sp.]
MTIFVKIQTLRFTITGSTIVSYTMSFFGPPIDVIHTIPNNPVTFPGFMIV